MSRVVHELTCVARALSCRPFLQSWHPKNLYNLYMRTYGPSNADTRFQKSALTMFAQKWKAKKLARGYHGDWIPETKFKRHFLPDQLPPIVGKPGEDKVPLASLMFAEIEKRLDTVVFRSCFAPSVYAARGLVIGGNVTLNGKKVRCGGMYRAALRDADERTTLCSSKIRTIACSQATSSPSTRDQS
jgi:ribosomal protein S4